MARLKKPQLPSQAFDDYWVRAERPASAGPYPEPSPRNGKWMLFVAAEEMDAWWVKVCDALTAGKLGAHAKIATMRENSHARGSKTKLICIYTYDSDDLDDVNRILRGIRELGEHRRIYYKEDAETLAGNYSGSGRAVTKYVAEDGAVEARHR